MSVTRARKASTARSERKAAAPLATSKQALSIGGHDVPVSNLSKVFYPRTGFTKAQVIDYYIRISAVLLPHLNGRPLTLKRYPDGVEGGFFYEKRCPPYRPDWVKTAAVWSERNDAEIHYCLADDIASIVWAANLGDLEMHTFLARAERIEQPTMMVFDLDPGAPADVLGCAEVGLLLKDLLDAMGLRSFCKTSGSKGLQVYVPLNTPVTYDDTKPFARALAEQLERSRPDLI